LTELKAHWRRELNIHAQNITPNVWTCFSVPVIISAFDFCPR
jgi:hypothetical protein